MAKTLKEVSNRVLRDLGRLPGSQTATAAQLKIVSDAYEGLYDSLFNDSLINWASTDDIPEFAVRPVVTMLKAQVAESFGNDPTVFLAQENAMRQLLASQLASPYESTTTQFENL